MNVSFGNLIRATAEINESIFPQRQLARDYETDSGGAGEFRGGLGTLYRKQLTAPATVYTYVVGRKYPMPGIAGGKPGAPNRLELKVGGAREEAGNTTRLVPHEAGEAIAYHYGGGGGWGDPLERDPAKVQADVDNGDVTEKAALEIYGVVLGDARATERRRHEIRARRLQGHHKPAHKLSTKQKFLATEGVAVHDNKRYGCAKCGTDLGPVSHNYKDYCVRNDLPIQAANPIVGDPKRFIDPTPQFRQFCCPGCGLLVENEIAVAEEPVLRDVEILSGG